MTTMLPRSLLARSTARRATFFARPAPSVSVARPAARWYSDKPAEENGAKEEKDAEEKTERTLEEVTKLLDEQKKATDEAQELGRQLKKDLGYAAADFANFQRIAKREKDLAQEKGVSSVAKSFLPTLDILPVALRSVPSELLSASAPSEVHVKALKTLYEGVEMLQTSLERALKEHEIEAFDPTGEKFNPDVHDALYQAPVPGKEPGTVLECQKVGYSYKGKNLRPAQVGVVQDSS